MISVPYRRTVHIAAGVQLTFLDAGHVLGSAITVLDVEDEGKKKRIVFTGDLGRTQHAHPARSRGRRTARTCSSPRARTAIASTRRSRRWTSELVALLKRAYERGGKVVIPSFALERAQEVVFALKRLRKKERMPQMPVYVDSPLTVKITDIFKLHPECYDAETRALIASHDSPFEFDELHYVSDKEDSQGDRRATRARDHHLGERDVRGGARPPPPEGDDRGPEEHRRHRRLPGAAHARAAHRRAARSA